MMLFKNNKVYVNNSDVRFMLHNYKYLDIPDEIFDTLIYGSNEHYNVIDHSNDSYHDDLYGMSFTADNENDWISFSDKKCIEYFEGAPYMIDYDEYLNMDDERIDREKDKVLTHIQKLKNYCNELNDDEKSEKIITININIEMLGHEYFDIIKMIDIRKKYINLPLPPDEPINNIKRVKTKVAKKDLKHIDFVDKAIFDFDLEEIYRHTNI
nr:hypothetical protein [Bacilli bacterium]